MARVYVTVDGVEYSKKKFGERWSEIVANYEVGISLSGEEEGFMSSVCRRIDRFLKVMVRGKVTFKVVKKDFGGNKVKGLVMVTPNSGYEVWVGKAFVIDKLYPKALLPDPCKINRNNVLKALRAIIKPQISEFRKNIHTPKSAHTGQLINGTYHVDHVYPFIRLVEDWARGKGLDLETVGVKCKGVVCKLADSLLAEDWFNYHMLNAKLQVLDCAENKSKGSRFL